MPACSSKYEDDVVRPKADRIGCGHSPTNPTMARSLKLRMARVRWLAFPDRALPKAVGGRTNLRDVLPSCDTFAALRRALSMHVLASMLSSWRPRP